eukprot:scaffold79584_cov31-Tisochrysis_lutea.AAC.1
MSCSRRTHALRPWWSAHKWGHVRLTRALIANHGVVPHGCVLEAMSSEAEHECCRHGLTTASLSGTYVVLIMSIGVPLRAQRSKRHQTNNCAKLKRSGSQVRVCARLFVVIPLRAQGVENFRATVAFNYQLNKI